MIFKYNELTPFVLNTLETELRQRIREQIYPNEARFITYLIPFVNQTLMDTHEQLVRQGFDDVTDRVHVEYFAQLRDYVLNGGFRHLFPVDSN
jgi:hypothetical protein